MFESGYGSTEDSRLVEFLDRVCGSHELETEWLDLLAQLEYVGCRKIMKSVGFDHVDALLLRHLQEEATHAYLLKRNAERRGLKRGWDKSQLGAWGWEYFQTVDSGVSRLADNNAASDTAYPACYQLVSFAIEERVLWLYPHYIAKTGDGAVKRALEQILAQEKHHGERFQNFETDRVRRLAVGTERAAWGMLMERLSAWASQ